MTEGTPQKKMDILWHCYYIYIYIFAHVIRALLCVCIWWIWFFFNLKCLLICFSIDNLIENDRRSLCPTKLLEVGWVPIFWLLCHKYLCHNLVGWVGGNWNLQDVIKYPVFFWGLPCTSLNPFEETIPIKYHTWV